MKLQSPPESEESFLTPKDVARRYKVTTRTVLNWVERGEVPAIRIGKVISFRLDEVIKAVEGYWSKLVDLLVFGVEILQ